MDVCRQRLPVESPEWEAKASTHTGDSFVPLIRPSRCKPQALKSRSQELAVESHHLVTVTMATDCYGRVSFLALLCKRQNSLQMWLVSRLLAACYMLIALIGKLSSTNCHWKKLDAGLVWVEKLHKLCNLPCAAI